MDENKEAPAMKESSEHPVVQQQDFSKSQEVRADEQHLQQQTSAHHQQSVESHSPSKTAKSSLCVENPYLYGILSSPKKSTVQLQQAHADLDDRPGTSKQAEQSIQFDQPLQPSLSSPSAQGGKRRSERIAEQHLQPKQFRTPDELKEEKKETEEKEEQGEKKE